MEKKEFIIDGNNIESLNSFYEEISNKLLPGVEWGRNFDALNDILHGGFGTPEEGFILVWKNSKLSKEKLGYLETLRWLNIKLNSAHPSHKENILDNIQKAERREGNTLFDMIIDIIRSHKEIELRLE